MNRLLLSLLLLHAPFALAAEKLSRSQERVIENWAYSLALQAATWGSPLVTMYALRDHTAVGPHPKAPPNSIWRMENIVTPELAEQLAYVTPNVNVVYGFGFMDLRQEPIVLTVPHSNDRYYMVQLVDMWTNSFAYTGGRSTGYDGGTFLLVGPNWTGKVPSNMQRIDCPTPWVLLQPRVNIYQNGQIDLPGAKEILNRIQTMGLSEYQGAKPPTRPTYNYPALNPVNPKLPVSDLDYKDPLQFWEVLSLALNENPPPQDQIEAVLPVFKFLGIELGKPWDRSQIQPIILSVMKKAAQQIGAIMSELPFGTLYHGALIPAPSIGNFGADYITRSVVARVGLTANIPSEAIYWMYLRDQNGSPLTGAKNYTMTFQQEIPCYDPGFWSLTIYDAKNNYTVPNSMNRYMLGNDTPLHKNSDGSFTIYIQKENPGKDKEANWLPTPPGSFYLVPRAYAPKPEMVELLTDINAWPVPSIVPVK